MNTLIDSTFLLPLAGFLTLFLLCLGVLQYNRVRKSRKELVEKIKFSGKITDIQEDRQSVGTKGVSFLNPLLNFIRKFGTRRHSDTENDGRSKRIKFLRAGIRRENAPAIFYGLKYMLVVLLPSIFLICRLTLFKITSNHLTVAIFVLVALLGYYLPDIWLRQKTIPLVR